MAEPWIVTPEPGGRLEQLLARYDMAKAAADAAAEALKAITDGIKAELAELTPDGFASVQVGHPELSQPLRMTATETWRFDSVKFKKDDPLTYVRYAKKSTSWGLRRAGGES